MATATAAKKAFNYERFGKLVRLFDSESSGEREAAVRRALRQCAESEPPVHFWEAVGAAFGSGVDPAEREALQSSALRAIAEAERERQRVKEIAGDAARQKEIIDNLEQENEQLAAQLKNTGPQLPDFNAFDRWFLRPKVLLVMIGLCVAFEWTTLTPLGKSWFPGCASVVAVWARFLALLYFVAWSLATFAFEGTKRLLAQWAVWAGGWSVVVAWIVWRDHRFPLGRFYFCQMVAPHNWWATLGLNYHPWECYVALGVLALVIDGCAGLPVTRKTGWVVLIVVLGFLSWIESFFRKD
jgi:hypothetical protein